MSMYQWSTTPANNATAGPINWAEGQAPSTVNDSARQMMADVATWYQSPEWLNYGATPTFVSSTSFTVPTNLTATYSVGRRIRAFCTAGTVYGTITASAFASVTTVTVAMDGTSALDSGLSEVDVGLMNPTNPSFPSGIPAIFSKATIGSTSTPGEVDLFINNSNTQGYFYLTASGVMGFWDLTRSMGRWSSDTYGNLVVTGNVTANSDERLKTDWEGLPADFVERLATVKSGTYTRIDTGLRQVGVGAQSLQPVLPEAVQDGEKLSVAYGQAALAACVELAKEVVRLRALLEPLK